MPNEIRQSAEFTVVERVEDSPAGPYVILKLFAASTTHVVSCDDLADLGVSQEVRSRIIRGGVDEGEIQLGYTVLPAHLTFFSTGFARDYAKAILFDKEILDEDLILRVERFQELLALDQAPFGVGFEAIKIALVRVLIYRQKIRESERTNSLPQMTPSESEQLDLARLAYIYTRTFHEFGSQEQLAASLLQAIIENDAKNVGFFSAQLMHAYLSGRDTVRGRDIKKGASDGGKTTKDPRPRTLKILDKMRDHVDTGKSVSRAAELTYRGGLGKSTEANRKLWGRNKPRK
jgi:hypothetical protein